MKYSYRSLNEAIESYFFTKPVFELCFKSRDILKLVAKFADDIANRTEVIWFTLYV